MMRFLIEKKRTREKNLLYLCMFLSDNKARQMFSFYYHEMRRKSFDNDRN